MKTLRDIQTETFKHFRHAVEVAGLAELYALEKKIERHYNAQTLTQHAFSRLDVRIMERIAQGEAFTS